MKKLLPFFSIAILAVACNQTPQSVQPAPASTSVSVAAPDTTGLASYQQWKAQNELSNTTAYAATAQPQQVTRVIRVEKPVYKTVAPKPVSSPAAPSSSAGTDVAQGTSGTASSESTGEAKAEKKQGISKAAKGAVIGGVAGAAGGAILNKKNRVLGAVIGGVIGAAGGYGIGHGMDKKDGRIPNLADLAQGL